MSRRAWFFFFVVACLRRGAGLGSNDFVKDGFAAVIGTEASLNGAYLREAKKRFAVVLQFTGLQNLLLDAQARCFRGAILLVMDDS